MATRLLRLSWSVVLFAQSADADVAWGRKAFSAEESLLALVRQSHADGAFIAENPGEGPGSGQFKTSRHRGRNRPPMANAHSC